MMRPTQLRLHKTAAQARPPCRRPISIFVTVATLAATIGVVLPAFISPPAASAATTSVAATWSGSGPNCTSYVTATPPAGTVSATVTISGAGGGGGAPNSGTSTGGAGGKVSNTTLALTHNTGIVSVKLGCGGGAGSNGGSGFSGSSSTGGASGGGYAAGATGGSGTSSGFFSGGSSSGGGGGGASGLCLGNGTCTTAVVVAAGGGGGAGDYSSGTAGNGGAGENGGTASVSPGSPGTAAASGGAGGGGGSSSAGGTGGSGNATGTIGSNTPSSSPGGTGGNGATGTYSAGGGGGGGGYTGGGGGGGEGGSSSTEAGGGGGGGSSEVNATYSSSPTFTTGAAGGGATTAGTQGSITLTWNVDNLSVTNPGTQSNTAGSAISTLTIAAPHDTTGGNTVTFSATGLPTGLSMNSTTGAITGTATTVCGCSVTVTATDSEALTANTTFTWNVTVGAASQLVFTIQPGGGTGGTAWTNQPKVTVEDAGGNTVASDSNSVTLTLTAGTGALAGCTSAVPFSLGVATFSGCKINGGTGSNYQLTATDSGDSLTKTSNTFSITVGAASQLVFSIQPGGGTGGTAWTNQPKVTVEDAGGNTVTGDASTVTLAIGTNAGPGGTLSGCTQSGESAGVVSFSGCKIDKVGTGYTLTATDATDGLNTASTPSSSFNITVGSASQLVFTIQPGGGTGGTAWTNQPKVTVEDAGGNTVTSDSNSVTLTLTAGTGALAGCTSAVPFSLGVATFSGCKINGGTGSNYQLTATDSGDSLTKTSNTFSITVGAASQLVFTIQPGGGTGGTAWTNQPKVTVEDAGGNTVASDSNSVTLTLTAGTGALAGCTSAVPFSLGVATFSGCKINGGTGSNYQLTATDSGDSLTKTSNTFSITVGAASQLVFSIQPGGGTGGTAWTNQPKVTVEDAGGNTVTGDASTVTLAIGTNAGPGGTLSGCTQSGESAGVVSFSGCKIDKVGTGYTLTATDATDGLNTASTPSSSFNITVGSASQLVFTIQPGGGTGGTAWTNQPKVTVEDAGGNTVTSDSNSVTLTLTAGTGALAGCTSAVPFSLGVATFSGCKINGGTGSNYQLTATDSGDSLTKTSNTFSITVGAASQLVFSIQPGGGTGGTAWTNQPKVTVEDAGGNTVIGDASTVTLAIGTNAGPGGTLSGCTQSGESAGVVSFSGCKIDKVGTGYTLTATDATDGLNTASTPSSSFNITVGSASQLVITTPNGGANGATWSTQPVVTIEDSGGNIVNSSASVTLAINTQPGSAAVLTCTPNPLAASGGVASFAGCNIVGKAGNYTLVATTTSPSLTSPPTGSFSITSGSASHLVFGQQPSNAYVGVSMSPPVTVLIEDNGGNVTSSTASIALTLTTNPCGGSPTVTNGTASAVNGTATFSALQISKECSGYALTATDSAEGGITAVSNTFTISAVVTSSANALADTATDTGGSGMNMVAYYYCSGFAASCAETVGNTIGSSSTGPNFPLSWSSLPTNGQYTLYAVGIDYATNSTTSAPGIPVTVDGTGPTSGAISVPTYANALSVTITTTDFTDATSGMASNVITRSNAQSPLGGACPMSGYSGATVVTSPDTGVTNGHCYEYTLTGTANDGTSASVTSGPVLVDTVPPSTTITINPSAPNGNSSWYKGTSPTFTLSASDTSSGVAATYYEIDGGPQTAYLGSAITIPDGSAQTITYWSIDNAGNTETAHTTAALKIDTVAPTGSITAPTANATVSGSAVTVSSNSADSGSGVASAQFQYSVHGNNSWNTIGTDTSSPYSVSWDTTSLTPGSYDLRVITTDVAGNSTTSGIVTVTVQFVGTYSGSTSADIPAGPSTTYYGIDTPSSTGSSTSTANTLTPGTATTLTGGTFTVSSTSGTRSWTATVGIVTAGVWAATAMTCNIAINAPSASCTLPGSVSVSATQSINLRVTQNTGTASRTGSWSVNYTQP